MTVTITITDPTATEATALRAYLTSLHGGTAQTEQAYTPTQAQMDSLDEYLGRRRAAAELRSQIVNEEVEIAPKTLTEQDTIVTAADAGAPDFDSAGMPWDERIHASSRATVADGTWRKKRGVSDELVAEVEAEISPITQDELDRLDANNAEKAISDDPNLTATDAELIEQAQPLDAPVQAQDAPEVPDAPAQDAPPPPPAATPNPFLAVMSRIGKSKLDKAKKDELLTAAGALDEKGNPSILVLNKRPELIDGFVALLDSEGV